MKQQGNKDLTQAEVLASELIKMAKDVTAADRKAFLEEHDENSQDPISKSTLSNYLNGKVYDNDTAVTVITFFKERIANRFQKIA